MAYVIFDILLLDEASLLKQPLAERRRLLETLTLQEPLLRSRVEPARDAAAIEKAFAAARERGNEGLLAKDPTSFYTPGRRGLAWIKLKKEFATLDVAVVAVEYGNGRRTRCLATIHSRCVTTPAINS